MKKTHFLLLLFCLLAARAAWGQPWTLENATVLRDTAQAYFDRNSQALFPPELFGQMNDAIAALPAQPTDQQTAFVRSGLLYLRSNHLFVDGNLTELQRDIDEVKALMKPFAHESACSELLGYAWEMEHIYYTNYVFDYLRAKSAADSARFYFKSRFSLVRIDANLAFLQLTCGLCEESRARIQRVQTAYDALSPEDKKKDPTFEYFIPYVAGGSYLRQADSLKTMGEPDSANAAYRAGLAEYAKIDTSQLSSPLRGIIDFAIEVALLYLTPADLSGAVEHGERAVRCFKQNGMKYQTGKAEALLGLAMTHSGSHEAGLRHILAGLDSLGYHLNSAYSGVAEIDPKDYQIFLIQALSMKAAAHLAIHEATRKTQPKNLEDLRQALRDAEMATNMLRRMQDSIKGTEQLSFELASASFGAVFSLGAYIGAKLYQITRQPDDFSRALQLADGGKNFSAHPHFRVKRRFRGNNPGQS